MRRILTFALALVAGLFVLGVPSAVAGGPTSVLLANYESGRSAAALNGSAAYTELQVVLGSERPPAGSTPPAAVTASDAAVRLVWLIHDVSPWRIDNVHLVGSDLWVATWVDVSGADPYAGEPTWHQPERGDDLVATLTGLGVLGSGGSGTGASTDTSDALVPDVAADPAPAAATAPASSGISWLLAAALAVGGVLVGTAAGTVLARRAPRPDRVSPVDDYAALTG